jgi:hypothetical protein
MFGSISNGNGYIQQQRFDGTATAYNLLLQPNGGNVGIGTTSPAAKLHVSKTDLSNELVTVRTQNNLSYADFGIQSGYARILLGGNILYAGSNAVTYFYNGGNTVMTMNYLGNVGIGTTSPTNKLDIRQSTSGGSDVLGTGAITIGSDNPYWTFRGTATSLQDLAFDRSYAGTWYESMRIQRSTGNVGIGTTSPAVKLAVYDSSTPKIHLQNTSSGTLISDGFQLALSGTNGYLWNYENGSMLFATNATERMRIDSTGNVGIGTTTPLAKFDVALNEANANTAHYVQLSNIAGGYVDWAFSKTFSNDMSITNRGTANSDTPVMTFKYVPNGGNVGIGTTSPSYKLDVNGSINGTSLYVNTVDQNSSLRYSAPNNEVSFARTSTSDEWFKIWAGSGSPVTHRISIISSGDNTNMRDEYLVNTAGYGFYMHIQRLPGVRYNTSKLVAIAAVNPSDSGSTEIWIKLLGMASGSGTTVIASNTTIRTSAEILASATTTAPTLTSNDTQLDITTDNRNNATLMTSRGATFGGNVGIGTASPAGLLNIVNSGNGTSNTIITQDNARKIKIGRDSIQATDLSDSGTNLYLNQGGGNVSIPNSGLVVGATGITYKFEVHSGATNVTSMFKSTDNQAWISIQDDDSGTYGALIGTDSDEGENFVVANSSAAKMLSLTSAGSFKLHNYDSTNQTGTPTYLLGTDASGNIVKTNTVPGSAAGPYLPLVGGTMSGTNGVLMPDNFKLKFGDATTPDLEIYHDGSNSFIQDVGTGSLLLKSNGAGIYLKGFTSTDTYAQFLEGGAVNLYYDDVKKFETTSTGVSVTGALVAASLDINGNADISGTLSGNFVVRSTNNSNTQANAINDTTIATTAYVNNKIQLIPAGLAFEGTWDARTSGEGGAGTPPSTTPDNGQFWIVSVDGSQNLSGITDWKVGDWAIYVDNGAGTDAWQKVDNSSVLDGSGTGQTLPLWSGSGTSNTLTDISTRYIYVQ